MKWTALSDELPPFDAPLSGEGDPSPRPVLVTNNLKARDRMGRLSHIWFGPIAKDPAFDGLCVLESGQPTGRFLSHWADPLGVEGALGQWVAFADRMPPEDTAKDNPAIITTRPVLVTNDLQARDAYGRLSNVWLASPMISHNESEGVLVFGPNDCRIPNLTHWLDVLGDPEVSQ